MIEHMTASDAASMPPLGDDHDPAGDDPVIAAYWDVKRAMIETMMACYESLRERFPPGAKLTVGRHEYCGGSVSLAGAEVDSLTWADADPKDLFGPKCEPAVRLILPNPKRYDGDSRVLTLTLADMVRAGAKA